MEKLYNACWNCFSKIYPLPIPIFLFLFGGIVDSKCLAQGSLEIKINENVQELSASFEVDIWAYPGNSDFQSLSVYFKFDPEYLRLLQAESDPANKFDLTLVNTTDEESGIIALEGGVFTPITDSFHVFSLSFEGIKETSESNFSFLFSEDSYGTAMINTALSSILSAQNHPPLNFSIVCSKYSLDAGVDQRLCGNETQLQGSTPEEGQGQWQVIEGSGGLFAEINNAQTPFSGVAGNSYTLVWALVGNSCLSTRDTVNIQFEKAPSQADAGENQILCSPSTQLAANTPNSGTGTWEILSGNGGVVDILDSPSSTFQGNPGETYRLKWVISNGVCTANSDEVEIQFLGDTEYAAAGRDQQICGSQAELDANTPSLGQGQWEIVSGEGGAIADRSAGQTQFTGLQGETYRLRWTLENPGCSSADEVEINFVENPSEPQAGADIFHCGNQVQLNAITPLLGTGSWQIMEGENGNIQDPTSPTTIFTGTQGNTYRLQWSTQNTLLCPTRTDDVVVSFDQTNAKSYAGEDQVVFGDLTYLEAIPSSLDNSGSWKVIGEAGGSNILDPTNPQSGFIGKIGQGYVLLWEEELEGCNPTPDTVEIFFRLVPEAFAGEDQETYLGITQLRANVPEIDIEGTWNLLSGEGGEIEDPNSPNSSFTGMADEKYLLEWVLSYEGMPLSRDTVEISFLQERAEPACIPTRYFSCPSNEIPQDKGPGSKPQIIINLPPGSLRDLIGGKRKLNLAFHRNSRFLQLTDSTGIIQGRLFSEETRSYSFEALIELIRPAYRSQYSLQAPEGALGTRTDLATWQLSKGFLTPIGEVEGNIMLFPRSLPYPKESHISNIRLEGVLTAESKSYSMDQEGFISVQLPSCEDICETGILNPFVHSLRAHAANREVYLQWEQVSLGNAGFVEIQKSRDGIHFFSLNHLEGKSMDISPYTASLIDKSVSEDSIYYYRILQYNPSEGMYTGPVQVVSTAYKSHPSAYVYPNPVSGENLHVFRENNYMKESTYFLYSLQGQLLLKGNLEGKRIAHIILGGISPGIYSLHIQGPGGKKIVEKVIKK